MRILHLTDRLTTRGGAHRHLLGLLDELARAGHDVHLAYGQHEGARVECPTHPLYGLEAREAAPVSLAPLLARVRPDVIHVHTVVNPAALEQAAGAGAIATVQDHRYFCPGRGKWTREGAVCGDAMSAAVCASCFDEGAYFDEVLGLTARRAEAVRRMTVVVLSEYMKRELVAIGTEAARVHVIPPFVYGLELAAAADGPPCLLIAGRLVEHKGIRDAVEAWRRARVDLPLVAAGTGPLRAELEAAGVEVLGWRDAPGLAAVYRRSRALLLSPRWQEPFGIAGLEALAFGVPVVAWESGGIREWHPGPLTAWGDVDALAAALRAAVEGRTPARAPRAPGREELMTRLMQVYREAAG